MKRKAYLVAGLRYGDEGKGATVDYIARQHPDQASLVVRYNGGAQAAHNVVIPTGQHHTFAQFGSAMLVPNARTHLSRFMIVHPDAMINEEKHLRKLGVTDAFSRTTIDEDCLVVTGIHREVNILREAARGTEKHGSCGMGIGEAFENSFKMPSLSIRVKHLFNKAECLGRLEALRHHYEKFLSPSGWWNTHGYMETYYDRYIQPWVEKANVVPHQVLSALLVSHEVSIFEGAQGMMIDQRYGTMPHVSWTDATFTNADILLAESRCTFDVKKIGIMRAYDTRHGAGPLQGEDPTLDIEERHNEENPYQGKFRFAPLCVTSLQYACGRIGHLDGVVVNHVDHLPRFPKLNLFFAPDVYIPVDPYRPNRIGLYMQNLASHLPCPLSIVGMGPTYKNRRIFDGKLFDGRYPKSHFTDLSDELFLETRPWVSCGD